MTTTYAVLELTNRKMMTSGMTTTRERHAFLRALEAMGTAAATDPTERRVSRICV